MDLTNLHKEFPIEDIEWRIQSSGIKNGKPWAKVLAYVTARAIMDRLDEVCCAENWQIELKELSGGFIAGIGILCGERWVWKWDGAQDTKIESTKGGISGAIKRAAVHWGIGRYLYKLDVGWADFAADDGMYSAKIENKWYKWNPPKNVKPKAKATIEHHSPEVVGDETPHETPKETPSEHFEANNDTGVDILSAQALMDKIGEAKAKQHLDNIKTKYATSFEALEQSDAAGYKRVMGKLEVFTKNLGK